MTEGVFQAEIEELRQLDLDASKAPWMSDPAPGSLPGFMRKIESLYLGGKEHVAAAVRHDDAGLILTSRNMLPRLLATLDQYRNMLERLSDECSGEERYTWYPDVAGAPVRGFMGCLAYRTAGEGCLACEAYVMLEQMDARSMSR